LGYEFVRVLNKYEPLPAAEHGPGGNFFQHGNPPGAVSFKPGERELGVIVLEHFGPNPLHGQPLEESVIAKKDTNRLDRILVGFPQEICYV
jgi:hypothetical protein